MIFSIIKNSKNYYYLLKKIKMILNQVKFINLKIFRLKLKIKHFKLKNSEKFLRCPAEPTVLKIF